MSRAGARTSSGPAHGRDGRGTSGNCGFTLVELLVVIGILLVLTAMTIGAINLSVTTERVRSGARQIQSLIEGSRDRAIYAREPRGIRILVNEAVVEDHDGDPATPEIPMTAATLVYIGSPGEYTSEPDRDDRNNNGNREEPIPTIPPSGTNPYPTNKGGPFVNVVNPYTFPRSTPPPPPLAPVEQMAQRALIGVGTRFAALYEQGLIGPGQRSSSATTASAKPRARPKS